MADSKAMVLRSVHLPPEMDDRLRSLAFVLRCSKADLIRNFVGRGLTDMAQRLGPMPSEQTREQILKEVQSDGGAVADRSGFKEDIGRMVEFVQQRDYA